MQKTSRSRLPAHIQGIPYNGHMRQCPVASPPTLAQQRTGMTYIAIGALFWSTSGLFIKLLTLSAFQIAAYRSLIAAFTMLAIARWRKQKLSLQPSPFNVLAAGIYAGILILFVMATKLTTAANAIFLQFSAPIYLLFLEPFFLKTPFKRRDGLAVVAALGAMSLFFMGKMTAGNLLGNVLGLASGACLAAFSLLLKHKSNQTPHEPPLGLITLGNFAVFLLCMPWLFSHGTIACTGKQWIILLYLGIFQIGVGYALFAQGITTVSATGASITSMLEAVCNPIWVFLGIGERPSPYAMVGGLLLLGVIAWYNRLTGTASPPSAGQKGSTDPSQVTLP